MKKRKNDSNAKLIKDITRAIVIKGILPAWLLLGVGVALGSDTISDFVISYLLITIFFVIVVFVTKALMFPSGKSRRKEKEKSKR